MVAEPQLVHLVIAVGDQSSDQRLLALLLTYRPRAARPLRSSPHGVQQPFALFVKFL